MDFLYPIASKFIDAIKATMFYEFVLHFANLFALFCYIGYECRTVLKNVSFLKYTFSLTRFHIKI